MQINLGKHYKVQINFKNGKVFRRYYYRVLSDGSLERLYPRGQKKNMTRDLEAKLRKATDKKLAKKKIKKPVSAKALKVPKKTVSCKRLPIKKITKKIINNKPEEIPSVKTNMENESERLRLRLNTFGMFEGTEFQGKYILNVNYTKNGEVFRRYFSRILPDGSKERLFRTGDKRNINRQKYLWLRQEADKILNNEEANQPNTESIKNLPDKVSVNVSFYMIHTHKKSNCRVKDDSILKDWTFEQEGVLMETYIYKASERAYNFDTQKIINSYPTKWFIMAGLEEKMDKHPFALLTNELVQSWGNSDCYKFYTSLVSRLAAIELTNLTALKEAKGINYMHTVLKECQYLQLSNIKLEQGNLSNLNDTFEYNNSKYLSKNYKDNTCVSSSLLYSLRNHKKIKLRYDIVFNGLDQTNLTLFDLRQECDKIRKPIKVYDILGNLILDHQPEKINTNGKTNLQFLAYNGHLFNIKDRTTIKELKFDLHDKYYFPDPKLKRRERDTILCTNLKSLESCINLYLKENTPVMIYCNNLKNALYWLVNTKKIIPAIVGTDMRNISGITFKNIYIKDNTSDTTGKAIIRNINELEIYNSLAEKASDILLSPMNISTYSKSLQHVIFNLPRTALIGSHTIDKCNCYEIDFNKFYPSQLFEMDKIPQFTIEDKFKAYRGKKIQDYTLYVIENTLVINDNLKMYDYYLSDDFCVVSGRTLKHYKKGIHIPFKIMYYCEPTNLIPNRFSLEMERLVKQDLPEHLVKNIINKLCGIVEKSKNKVAKKFIASSYEEAVYLRDKIGNCKIVNIAKPTKPLWLVESYNRQTMTEGFYTTKLYIYDMCRFKLFQLRRQLESMKATVVGVHTDCLYITKESSQNILNDYNAYKSHKKHTINWGSGFQWNTLKIQEKKLYESPLRWNIRVKGDFDFMIPKNDVITPLNIIHMKDEYNHDEFLDILQQHKRIAILARLPGSGKTELCKKIKNPLFVCPDHNTVCSLIKDGYNACTYHKFFGKNHRGQPVPRFKWKNDTTIIFEEAFKTSTNIMTWMDEFMKEKPDIHIVLNGDPNQLPGVNPDINLDTNTVEKISTWIKRLFPIQIHLLLNKSLTDKKQISLMNAMYDDIWVNKIPISVFCNRYLQHKHSLHVCPKNARFITQTHESVARIHDYFFGKRIMKGKPFCVGMEIMCKKRLNKFNLNSCYTITAIGRGTYVLDNEHKIKRNTLLEHFTYTKALVGYAVQGKRFSEPLVLCDIGTEDKQYSHRDIHKNSLRHHIWTAITRSRDLNNIYIHNLEYYDGVDCKTIHKKITEAHQRRHCSLHFRDIRDMLKKQNYRCNICSCLITKNNLSLNRIDNNLDYDRINVEITCWPCNRRIK